MSLPLGKPLMHHFSVCQRFEVASLACWHDFVAALEAALGTPVQASPIDRHRTEPAPISPAGACCLGHRVVHSLCLL